jgi:oligoribonuclease NrnB/cAMP/cGMP phosphodiesterase (DHH superfamily)
MRLFHLSHTDLDGYGCQYIASKFMDNARFFNSNYGNEINARLKQMTTEIEALEGKDEQILFLITDLNLTAQDCRFLDDKIRAMNTSGFNIELKLLDHHISGKEQADEFDWYTLDNNRCGTKLTYDYFGEVDESTTLLVNAINAIDLWKEEEPLFEFGKTLMRVVGETKELNKLIFPSESVAYKLYALERSKEFLGLENANIELDNAIHFFKKDFLRNGEADDTIDNLSCRYVTQLLSTKKGEFSVEYAGYSGFLTVSIGNVSVIANGFLSANEEYDFFIDVSPKGNISLRSSNKADVSEIAKTLFGGGGHKNASGGRANNIREFFTYAEYKKAIEQTMKATGEA